MSATDHAERQTAYEPFFGLKEPPFSLAPDPRFLFASASHSAALTQIAYAIDRREPIVVVTGEIGTGKTLLCRTVLQRLPRKVFVSVVNDPLLGPDDLLKQLLRDFGLISPDSPQAASASRHELVHALQGFLRSLAAIQAHAVVIIDEAQHLQPAVLEQIRLLSNIDDERGTLLQIILVGQNDVEPLLSRPELRQIQQRVSRRFRLERLTRDEVQQYIEHRLARARDGVAASQVPGATELARALTEWEGEKASVAFEPAAIEAISRITGGLPRQVNLICDRALEQAFAARVRVVDVPLVQAAARAIGAEQAGLPETPDVHAARDAGPAPAPQAVAVAADDTAGMFGPAVEATPARRSGWLVLAAAALVVVAAAIWIGFRAAATPSPARQPAAAPPAPTSVAPSAARALETPPAAPAAAKSPAGIPPATHTASKPPAAASPAAGSPEPPAAGAPPAHPGYAAITAEAGGAFEIVVASFKTESRAQSVAADLAALGLPARRRVRGIWQQVICGPFATRSGAEEAQQRLERAGYADTEIAATVR
ncbi:MAG: AAA family ATPase [Betaproteobacteria bacterium]